VVVCADGLIWADQNGRKVGKGGGTNGWWRDSKIWGEDVVNEKVEDDSGDGQVEGMDLNETLENSQLVWVEKDCCLLILQMGGVLRVKFFKEGRSVSRMQITRQDVEGGRMVSPSCVERLKGKRGEEFVFIGSMVEEGWLVRIKVEGGGGLEEEDEKEVVGKGMEVDDGGYCVAYELEIVNKRENRPL
jgi:hypothetical protein